MRRLAVPAALFLVLSLMIGLRAPARAQEATPMGGAMPSYPKLSVTVTNDSISVESASVPAGWVMLSATNQMDQETGISVAGPPPGKTVDEMITLASTPVPNDAFPEWAYTSVFPGGPNNVLPGETAEAIIYLPAGEWAVITEGNQIPVKFSTADGPDSVTTEPSAASTIELGDFYFAGLDKGLPAGSNLVKVTNTGKQIHMLVMGKGPDTMTMDMLMEAIGRPDNATPAPGQLSEDQLAIVHGIMIISPGQTAYLPMNLDSGVYFALCFVTDPATGVPHAMEGMATVFTVA